MSEDKFEQEDAKDDEVEAHKKKAHLNLEATELGSDESDDVEAHRRKAHANEEPASEDDSDDVEAHRRKA
jgi:hypothetical protein